MKFKIALFKTMQFGTEIVRTYRANDYYAHEYLRTSEWLEVDLEPLSDRASLEAQLERLTAERAHRAKMHALVSSDLLAQIDGLKAKLAVAA
jgi:hypothetical protein